MARRSGFVHIRSFSIVLAAAMMATVPTALAQNTMGNLPAHARTPLEAIEPVPVFPDKNDDVTTVSPDGLSGSQRRAWRDANSLFADGRWQDAAGKLDSLIAAHPGFAEGRVLRARCYARVGDAGKAAADLSAAIAADPRHVAAHELAGETALLAGDRKTAVYEFRLALTASASEATSADRALALLFLARTLEADGYLAAASDLYAQFLDATENLSPDMRRNDRLREMVETTLPELRRRIAAIHARLGDKTQAADAWERVVKERPDDANAWRELAHAQARRGDVDEAYQSLRRYLDLAQLGAGALVELDSLCRLLPAASDCDARTNRMVESLGDTDLSLLWAKRQKEAGLSDRAIELLVKLAASHPDLAGVHEQLADLYAEKGDMDAACAELVAACRVDPGLVEKLKGMLHGRNQTFRPAELVDAARANVERHPDDVTTRLIYAALLSATQQTDSAVEQLIQVTQAAPENASAWVSLADAHVRQLNWEAALEATRKAIAAGDTSQHVYYLAGVAHDALSQDSQAIEAFEKAGQIGPNRSDAFMGIADIAERNGDRRTAERVYRQILAEVDPDCVEALERLIERCMNQRRVADAQKLFEMMQKRHPGSPAEIRCSAMIDLLAATAQSPDKRLSDYLDKLRSILKDHPDDSETYVELAKTYFAVSRFDDALKELESALRADPHCTKALELKAESHVRLLDFAAAETVVDRLLKFRPRDVRYLQSKVDYASSRGASDTTIATLKDMVARDELAKDRDRFTLELIQELRAADRYEEAVDVSNKWSLEKPDAFRLSILLENLGLAGRHDEAIAIAHANLTRSSVDKQMGKILPESAGTDRQAQIQYLACLQSAHRYTEAMQETLKWLEANPQDYDLTAALIRLCWSARDWDDAIDIARTALDETNEPRKYEQLLTQTYQFAGRDDEAIEIRREEVRRFQKLLDGARGSPHEMAIELNLRDANYRLINAMMMAGRYADAERLAESLLSSMVNEPPGDESRLAIIDLRNILSEVYRQSGQISAAIEQLEAIHAMAPLESGACNNLSYTLADTGRQIERAEKLVRTSLSQDPTSSASLDTLGWVLYKKGKFDEAAYYLRRAARAANFSDPVIFDHLADALYRDGDARAAERYWAKAMTFCDPEGDPPPTRDRLKLHGEIKTKLMAHKAGEKVETAPLADASDPTSAPAEDTAAAE